MKTSNKNLAPICLFTFNRLDETIKTVEALKKNHLALYSELYIFSDGPKNDIQKTKINEVRNYLHTIDGFKNVTIIESTINIGLANSIINGVSKVIKTHSRVIVIEDDLVTSSNFLDFMNQAIDFYKNDKNVISISGFTLPLPGLKSCNQDYYFGVRASSWGWGTWQDRWEDVDWEMKNYDKFIQQKPLRRKFREGGSDMVRMLNNQNKGKIDSWAIRFCFHQFNKGMFTVFPSKSKIYSIGFSKDATHTKSVSRFDTKLDDSDQRQFLFKLYENPDKQLLKEFRSFFSIQKRLLDKVKSIFS
ncbi:glycosyltransferase [Belliella marina]|uniref:Glycosyltransferase n=1 Tax=Belliella marina TaxID=1644146 RepID=A0ABW4VNR6_9BACT